MADEPLDALSPEEQQLLRLHAGTSAGKLDAATQYNDITGAAGPVTVERHPVYSYPEEWAGQGVSKAGIEAANVEKRTANDPAFNPEGGPNIASVIGNYPVAVGANIGRQFWYGSNIAVQYGKDIYRKLTNDYDPTWTKDSVAEWLKSKPEIPADKWSWYYQTGSKGEASALLANTKDNEWAARVNSHRGGVENFIAGTVAGFVDVDLPLTIASFKLSAAARAGLNMTRTGVIMRQAAIGAGSAIESTAIDMQVTPGRTYEDAILSTLIGTGIGIIAGGLDAKALRAPGATADALQDVTHEMRKNAVEETAENIATDYQPRSGVHSVQEPEPPPVNPAPKPVDGGPVIKAPEVPEPAKARPDAPEPTPEALPGSPRAEEQTRQRPGVFPVPDPERLGRKPEFFTVDEFKAMGGEIDGIKPLNGQKPRVFTMDEFKALGGTIDEAKVEAKKIQAAETTAPQLDPTKPAVFSTKDVIIDDNPDFDPLTHDPSSSIGAAGANQHGTRTHSGPGLRSIPDTEVRNAVDANLRWRRRSDEVADWENTANVLSANSAYTETAVRGAIRFRDALAKVGITNDFDVMMGSGLASAQRLAVNMFESASGIARKQITAALMKESYANELKAAFKPYHDAFADWHAIEQGYKTWDWLNDAPGTRSWKSKDDFNKEVLTELMSRRFGGTGTASKSAKAAADAVEATYKLEHEIGRGRGNDIPLAGYDQFEWTPGHFSQMWSGRKMSEALDEASANGGRVAWDKKKKAYIDTLDEMYSVMSTGFDPTLRKKVATTVVERAIASRRGFQHDLIALLSGDESDYIRTALKNNGVSDGEIESVITAIMGSREDKTQLRQTRKRQDVDFRFTSKAGINMMDMLETDIELVLGRRMLQTSGLAALARIGITNRVDWEFKKKQILAEQEARGPRISNPNSPKIGNLDIGAAISLDADKVITADMLDGYYGYFSGIRPNGRTSSDAVVQRIKKVTQLSLMNQLGLTSLGEFGTIAGAVGFKRMWQHFTDDLKFQFTNKGSDLHKELRAFAIFVPEEQMFNARLMHDIDQAEVGNLGAVFDALLNKGVELQGVMSGFYKVRAMQQMTAIASVTAKVWEGAKFGSHKNFSAERLADIGFDQAFMNRVFQHAEFEGAKLKRLNMDFWDPQDVEHYRRVIARSTHQLIQKALAGESNWAFSQTGIAQLFWQLKSFPLLAVNKQFIRNARFGDIDMLMTYVHGIALSSAVYAAKESLNAKSEELTPEKILKGGLNYANMTGWMPMIVDPILGSIGADASMSGYSSHGTGSVLSIPASFSVGDRLLQLPGAALKLPQALMTTAIGHPRPKDEQMTNAQIRALQAIPIIGNMYGMAALLNHAKEPWDKDKLPPKQKKIKPENAPATMKSPLDLQGRAWQEMTK